MCPCKSQAAGFASEACQQVHRWDRTQALLESRFCWKQKQWKRKR